MVVQVATDVGKLECAFNHAAWGIAIVAEDASRQTAVVGADAHGSVQALALLYQRLKHLHMTKTALPHAYLCPFICVIKRPCKVPGLG